LLVFSPSNIISVTLTVEDAAGNTDQCTQNIQVERSWTLTCPTNQVSTTCDNIIIDYPVADICNVNDVDFSAFEYRTVENGIYGEWSAPLTDVNIGSLDIGMRYNGL